MIHGIIRYCVHHLKTSKAGYFFIFCSSLFIISYFIDWRAKVTKTQNKLDRSSYSSIMLLIAAKLVQIPPFQPMWEAADLILVNVASHTGLDMASQSFEGWDVSLVMASIWRRLCVTQDFVRSCSRGCQYRSKLAEVVPRKDAVHILVMASKLVVLLPRNWHCCFAFRERVIQFFGQKYFTR